MSNTATENDYLSIGGGVNLFDDEARFILKNRNKLQEFKDLDFRFGRNPNTNDVVLSTGDNAVKQAIRNILLTQYYERPFRPGIGAGIRSLLFEQRDEITARQLEDAISEAAKLMTLLNLFQDKEEYEKCAIVKTRLDAINKILKKY